MLIYIAFTIFIELFISTIAFTSTLIPTNPASAPPSSNPQAYSNASLSFPPRPAYHPHPLTPLHSFHPSRGIAHCSLGSRHFPCCFGGSSRILLLCPLLFGGRGGSRRVCRSWTALILNLPWVFTRSLLLVLYKKASHLHPVHPHYHQTAPSNPKSHTSK